MYASRQIAHRSAKVWRDFKLETTLGGHGQSVLAVLALDACEETQGQEATLTGALLFSATMTS